MQRIALVIISILFVQYHSFSQVEGRDVPDGTTGLVSHVSDSDFLAKKIQPNEFNGTNSTCRLGMGYILDYATYGLSNVFKQQMDSAGLDFESKFQTRDFRVMASGVLKAKRTVAWKFAYMYDGNEKTWLMRESGLTIGVPELAGHIFVGRTKEGYSMIKVMNGHSGITAERQMALDVIPILADGIKWFGFLPKQKIFWNLGYYNDIISKGQSFSTYEWQYDARIGCVPYYNKETNEVVHIATNLRYGKPTNKKISLKSRPESNPAPQIINTGSFQSDYSTHVGAEFYYSNGNFLIGSEVVMNNFQSKESEDHKFFGGDICVSYLFTKGKRPYNVLGNILGFVKVENSVFEGGAGEWEAVLRFSNLDLDDGFIHGGKFWRITPMVNWYLSKVFRMEFVYGYGELERFNLKGALNIYQVRLQLSVL